jgi:hypothetical protein
MNTEEDIDQNLITSSLVSPYDNSFKSQYTTIRKLNSQCQILSKRKIYKDSFSIFLSRIYAVDSGYMAIGSLRSWFDSLQFYIIIVSFDFELNKTHEHIIPIKHGLEPWWFMGKSTFSNEITCVVSVSDYPAPSSGKRYNLFLSTNYDLSNIKYNLYPTSNYTDYCWDMESSIDNGSFWCPGHQFLMVDSFMNLKDSILQPYHPDLCAGNTMGLKKLDQNNFIYAVSSCKDTNRNVVIMKLDKNLKPSLPITFGTKDYDIANPGKCLDWKKKDHIYVGGSTAYINFIDPTTFFLASLDANLNLKWVKFFGGDYFYRLLGICATTDGGCLMGGGVSYNSNMYESDVFLLKVDSSGIITSNNDFKGGFNWNFSIYPNPSQDYFILDYENLFEKCSFEILDQLGRQVIIKNLNITGKQLVEITKLIHGTYYYRIISGNKVLGSGMYLKI